MSRHVWVRDAFEEGASRSPWTGQGAGLQPPVPLRGAGAKGGRRHAVAPWDAQPSRRRVPLERGLEAQERPPFVPAAHGEHGPTCSRAISATVSSRGPHELGHEPPPHCLVHGCPSPARIGASGRGGLTAPAPVRALPVGSVVERRRSAGVARIGVDGRRRRAPARLPQRGMGGRGSRNAVRPPPRGGRTCQVISAVEKLARERSAVGRRAGD
jgi:hypothetical protein